MPLDSGAQDNYDDFSNALQSARQTILSNTTQLKELFSGIRGPLSPSKVSLAKDVTDAISRLIKEGDMPLKLLLCRRSPDPDPYIHAINVSALSMAMADEVGLDKPMVREIGLAALLHDIGLFYSSSDLFFTTAATTFDEKTHYWEHPTRGAELLIASPAVPDTLLHPGWALLAGQLLLAGLLWLASWVWLAGEAPDSLRLEQGP